MFREIIVIFHDEIKFQTVSCLLLSKGQGLLNSSQIFIVLYGLGCIYMCNFALYFLDAYVFLVQNKIKQKRKVKGSNRKGEAC